MLGAMPGPGTVLAYTGVCRFPRVTPERLLLLAHPVTKWYDADEPFLELRVLAWGQIMMLYWEPDGFLTSWMRA